MPDRPTHVLLDLDGTLTDSAPGIMACLRTAFTETGIPVPDDARLRRFVGPPLGLSLARLGLTHDQAEAVVTVYRRELEAGGMYDNAVFDGVPGLLAALRAAGTTLVVATAKPQPLARPIVEHFGLHRYLSAGLDSVFGPAMEGAGEHTGKEKVVARALAASGGDQAGAAAVMVGDREHDVHAAAANGIPAIGVAWGYGEPGELEEAGVAAVAGTPEELRGLLLG
ncbi:HAD hydrolase-like protein [Myceligenerans salitolerans]|uniref:HAD hydrolase-like protein n=1 Tax=Myceligenerans salitolerans TaxID=1230528 RepID=A0ABS3ICI2_9MICO|nr:HAD hydrolase-like protein [Myceligenerans salitolerans]